MAPLIEVQLFIVVAMMSYLDADVRIVQTRINAGNNCTECGEKLVLTCYIDNYFPNSTMTWQNENSSLTLVSCTGFTCSLNPSVSSEYSKSEDTTTGTFNLIVPTVTRDNNGISYVCENGLFTESSIVKVRDYRPILNETIGTTLKARTGCINESVKVIFSWRKFKAGSGAESYDDAEYIGTNGTVDTDFCTQDTECGLNGFITLERTIEVEPGDGNDYHLIAVISYDGFEMESVQTNKTYKIGAICVFGVEDGIIIVFFILFFIGHLGFAFQKVCRIYKDMKSTRREAIISNLPAIIFLVMYSIVYFVCKHIEKPCIFCNKFDTFGEICGLLLCVSYIIGILLIAWICVKGKSQNQYRNAFFFWTFVNLIIFGCIAGIKTALIISSTQHESFKPGKKKETCNKSQDEYAKQPKPPVTSKQCESHKPEKREKTEDEIQNESAEQPKPPVSSRQSESHQSKIPKETEDEIQNVSVMNITEYQHHAKNQQRRQMSSPKGRHPGRLSPMRAEQSNTGGRKTKGKRKNLKKAATETN